MARIGLLAALMGLLAVPSWGAETPVCARSAVVERVSILLREAGRDVRLSEASVGERSTGTDRLVHCAVRGTVLGYDTNQQGAKPIDATFVVQYTLELRQNGIFLHIE